MLKLIHGMPKKGFGKLLSYVKANKKNFEISKFDGDAFWFNHMCYHHLGKDLNTVFMLIHPKDTPQGFWLIMDNTTKDILATNLYERYKNAPELLREGFASYRNEALKELRNLVKTKNLEYNPYQKYARAIREFSAHSVFTFEALEGYLGLLFGAQFKNAKEREILSFPFYSSYVQRYDRELLLQIKLFSPKEKAIVNSIRLLKGETIVIEKDFSSLYARNKIVALNKYPHLQKILQISHKKWAWVFNNYSSHDPISDEKIFAHIGDLLNNFDREINILKLNEIKRKEKKILLKTFSLKEKNLINLIDIVAELRDKRKAFWLESMLPVKKWIKKISKNLGLNYEEIRWLTWEEQCDFIKNPPKYKKLIDERKNNLVTTYGYGNNPFVLFSQNNALRIMNILFEKIGQKSLKGICATPGKVVGKIKNIGGEKEFNKFKSEEILVTSHTTPDYIVLMKKAKAILTERGGITSHAAIVSRELGIPCVVGIKNVFNNFKDGDLVEVDADNGVISLLK